MRTRRNKAKIETMNGLENHHCTMQNTSRTSLSMASTRDVLACTTKEYSETLSRPESPTPRRECQCSTYTETPTQQSATTQDQHHAQGLALCHDVTLDIVTHRWVPAGHPQYTGAREGRLWVAQAQTQLTLFVDPQSLSLECEQI